MVLLNYCNKLMLYPKQSEELLKFLFPKYYWNKYEPSGRHNTMVVATRLEF